MKTIILTLGLIYSLSVNLYSQFIINKLKQRILDQNLKLYTQWVELNAYEISNKNKFK